MQNGNEEPHMNSIFVEAVALLEAAGAETGMRAKLELLGQAETDFQKVIKRSPSTDLAVNESEAAQSTYACVISQALVIAQTIVNKEKRTRALVDIAGAQARSGDRTGALESFSKALAVARTIDGQWEGPRLLADIAEAQTRSGDCAGALESFVEAVALVHTIKKDRAVLALEDQVDATAALAYIAEAQTRSGDRAGAQKSFSQALTVARAISKEREGVEALAHITEALTRALLYIAEADGTVQAVVAARTITNEWRKAQLLVPILWLDLGPFSRDRQNKELAEKQILTLTRIAATRAETGDIMQAVAQMSANKWERSCVLAAIGEGQARAGKPHGGSRELLQDTRGGEKDHTQSGVAVLDDCCHRPSAVDDHQDPTI